MLIKNEDSVNNLYDFTCTNPSCISLFHFINLENNKLNKEVNKDGNKNEDVIINNENQKKNPSTVECIKNLEDNSENYLLSIEEKRSVDNLNSNENIPKKVRDFMNSNENLKTMFDLVYHESYKLIYEDTNIHIELPSIIYDKDNNNDSNNNNIEKKINNVRKIDDLKDYLNSNLKYLNLKNEEHFLKNINLINEILNYNYFSIYKNMYKSDIIFVQNHDNFLYHIPKMKKELQNDKTKSDKENFNLYEKNAFSSNANIDECILNCDFLHKVKLCKDEQKKRCDEIKVDKKFSEENDLYEKNILKKKNEQTKIKSKNCRCIYEKIKNIYCMHKPGINYKYIYPPNHRLDNIKELYISKANILFNSKFESANLQYAIKEKNKEIYSLFLNHDIRMNEKKNQWFYFSASYVPDEYYKYELDKKKNKQRNMSEFLNEINKDIYIDSNNIKYSVDSSDKFSVSNIKKLEKPFTVRFKIVNMSKPYFLYKEGYSPLVFSECKSKFENIHWERCAYNVKYIKNTSAKYFNIKKNCFENMNYNTYSLEFNYDFTYSYDTVYFCSCYPYTYSYLIQYLNSIENYLKDNKTINYIEKILCKTSCGFKCPIIAITNYDHINTQENKSKENQKDSDEINDITNEKFDKNIEEKNNFNNEPGNMINNNNFTSNHENAKTEKGGDIFQNDECFCIKHCTNLKNKENEMDNKGITSINKKHCFSPNNVINLENEGLYTGTSLGSNNVSKINNLYTKEYKKEDYDNQNNNDKMFHYNLLYNLNENSLSENVSKNVNTYIKSDKTMSSLNIMTQNTVNKSSNAFMNEFPSLLKKDVIYETKKNKTRESLNSNGIVNFQKKEKNIIFLTARVHPGETNASYAMHGFLSFIISDNIYANILRDNFIFIIIPMLNIDGVVLGHNRYCSNGYDLNRQWNKPIFYLHPTIYAAKSLIKKISKSHKIVFFCDFHGHSRKYNCFLFGNSYTSTYIKNKKFAEIFPEIITESLPWFSLKDTKFKIENENRGIARYICGYEFNIDCSYTLEMSLIGVKIKKDFNFLPNITKDLLLTKNDEMCRSKENKEMILNSSGIYEINEKKIQNNMDDSEINEKTSNNLFQKHEQICNKEEKEKGTKIKINETTKEIVANCGKCDIVDGDNSHLNENYQRKNSKELNNTSKIENHGNIVDYYYDPNIYDFFYYDENMFLMTGISFGISLFKFMNFSAYYESSLYKVANEKKLLKSSSLARNLKCINNNDELEGLNVNKSNNSNGLKQINSKKKVKIKKKDLVDNSLNFSEVKISKNNLQNINNNNVINDTEKVSNVIGEERKKKKLVNNEQKSNNNYLSSTSEKNIITSNNLNNYISNNACYNYYCNNKNGDMLADNNSSSASKFIKNLHSHTKKGKKIKYKKTSYENNKEYLENTSKNTKIYLKEKEVNNLNIINKKKNEEKLPSINIKHYGIRHTINSFTENDTKYFMNKNINSTYCVKDFRKIKFSAENKTYFTLNSIIPSRENIRELNKGEKVHIDSFLCISDNSKNNDNNFHIGNHNNKSSGNNNDNKKYNINNEHMNYEILLNGNMHSKSKIQLDSKKCKFVNKERKNKSRSATIKSKKYMKEKDLDKVKTTEKKNAILSDSYLGKIKTRDKITLSEYINNKTSYVDNGNKKIKESIKLSRNKKIKNEVYTADCMHTKKKQNEMENKHKCFIKGNINTKEKNMKVNKTKNNLKICKSLSIIKIVKTKNMESEINCYSFPILKDNDKNMHVKRKKKRKKKSFSNIYVTSLITKMKNYLKSEELFYDNKYFKILNLKKKIEKCYNETNSIQLQKIILKKSPFKIETSSKMENVAIKEKKKKKNSENL
ncbi:zinc-carboxypeptidase, putative [Plasmodium relictum]|uniref:Zinc-carboxypeptidase, putative n=1 Tax=Plasmodium relictum TaxID=85471 RepID=A0A1J1HDU6_PLARL|nr:zinc-carboxypeptidase, putative [Plasmodium relictum]CRH03112.1 zinc-carboxypeptidase, putative [Plasmodium relictum]